MKLLLTAYYFFRSSKQTAVLKKVQTDTQPARTARWRENLLLVSGLGLMLLAVSMVFAAGIE